MDDAGSSVAVLDELDSGTDARGVLVSRGSALHLWGMSGDLWLFRTGLLHMSYGLLRTVTCIYLFYDLRHPTIRTFDPGEFARVTTDPRNLWIPRDSITSAHMRHAIYCDELRATLADGRSLKVLWQTSPATYRIVRAALEQWLGERLEVRSLGARQGEGRTRTRTRLSL